jgi:CDP-diacylglycerol--glycerol-3-phosphate 3-phosphatidyltransferase
MADPQIFNIPNQITMVRLLLSILLFVTLPMEWYWTSLGLFALAAGTDWLDGYWARKHGQITQLGRILDPFCDKILICGTYILLAVAMRDLQPWYYAISGWMAVVVVGREMLVTALRGFIESSGGDFSAKMAGKLKMVFQCVAAGAAMVALAKLQGNSDARESLPNWLTIVLVVFVWLSVASTVQSGIGYVIAAARAIKGTVARG